MPDGANPIFEVKGDLSESAIEMLAAILVEAIKGEKAESCDDGSDSVTIG